MSSRVVFGATPRNHWHNGVVVQVQERNLIVFLPEYKENRVEEFGQLGDEVNIAAACFL
jgi:hypothetical protein